VKKILFAVLILFVSGALMYAEQEPTSAETRQSAQQYLTQARSNVAQFETVLNNLKARNVSSIDAAIFARFKSEIDQLEKLIHTEETQISASIDRGRRVSRDVMSRIERLITQHSEKVAELESFIAN
jgi:cob(I)alamin adenosyltransferase